MSPNKKYIFFPVQNKYYYSAAISFLRTAKFAKNKYNIFQKRHVDI